MWIANLPPQIFDTTKVYHPTVSVYEYFFAIKTLKITNLPSILLIHTLILTLILILLSPTHFVNQNFKRKKGKKINHQLN